MSTTDVVGTQSFTVALSKDIWNDWIAGEIKHANRIHCSPIICANVVRPCNHNENSSERIVSSTSKLINYIYGNKHKDHHVDCLSKWNNQQIKCWIDFRYCYVDLGRMFCKIPSVCGNFTHHTPLSLFEFVQNKKIWLKWHTNWILPFHLFYQHFEHIKWTEFTTPTLTGTSAWNFIFLLLIIIEFPSIKSYSPNILSLKFKYIQKCIQIEMTFDRKKSEHSINITNLILQIWKINTAYSDLIEK